MSNLKNIAFLQRALSQYGIMEVKGKADNPEILKYFTELGFDGSWVKDETSWCSAFVNWCAKQTCLPYTGKLNARSWLEIGEPTQDPQQGDVLIFWRGSHPDEFISGTQLKKGHVGIYINEDANFYYCLGGNQSNMVCISAYAKHKILGIRRLA